MGDRFQEASSKSSNMTDEMRNHLEVEAFSQMLARAESRSTSSNSVENSDEAEEYYHQQLQGGGEMKQGPFRLDETERTDVEDSDYESAEDKTKSVAAAAAEADLQNDLITRIDSLEMQQQAYHHHEQNRSASVEWENQVFHATCELSAAEHHQGAVVDDHDVMTTRIISAATGDGSSSSTTTTSNNNFDLSHQAAVGAISDAVSDAEIFQLIQQQEEEERKQNEAAINAILEENRTVASSEQAAAAAAASSSNNDSNNTKPYSKNTVHELYRLCMEARPNQLGNMDPKKWDPVRTYLMQSPDLVEIASRIPNNDQLLPIHQVCRHNPPMDIIELFISSPNGLDLIQQRDKNLMLPIHHACIHSASDEVIRTLVQLYPESKELQDSKGGTPLHHAVANVNSSVELIECLASEAAAASADQHGMLPLHYTVVYKAFAKPSIIRQLIVANPRGLSNADLKGRIPARWLAKSCHIPEVLDLLQFSIAFDATLAQGDMGLILLNHLAECAERHGKSPCTQAFLNLLIENNPEPTEMYSQTLKSLPRWLNKKGELQKTKSFFRRLKKK